MVPFIFCSFMLLNLVLLDGHGRCWVRPSLPSLRMMTGAIQHFFSSIIMLGVIVYLLS